MQLQYFIFDDTSTNRDSGINNEVNDLKEDELISYRHIVICFDVSVG